jgi:hypothetical protein
VEIELLSMLDIRVGVELFGVPQSSCFQTVECINMFGLLTFQLAFEDEIQALSTFCYYKNTGLQATNLSNKTIESTKFLESS